MIRDRDRLARTDAHDVALACVERGIEAAHPRRVIADEVAVDGDTLRIGSAEYDLSDYDEVLVLGGGNAAGHVAVALEAVLKDRIDRGIVVTDDVTETESMEVVAGDHPVPSERAVEGTRRLLDLAREAGEDTLVLAAITGGGSALLPAPADGIPLADLQATTEALVESGAAIHEINAVRKHLSDVKGGGLARAAAPATVVGLVLSDVVGNDLDTVASGPTAPDGTTVEDALAVLSEYDVGAPESVRERLEAGARGEVPETPQAGDSVFDRTTNHVLADGFTALDAAREAADEQGYSTLLLSSRIRGEAREAAKTHAAIAEEIRATGNPLSAPAVVLSGGEATVTVRGDGEGGPSEEFALSAAVELAGVEGVCLACVDTDGIDGATDAAGALIDGDTVDAPAEARAALRENDAHPYLEKRGTLLETGATGTNVNDLRVLVVED